MAKHASSDIRIIKCYDGLHYSFQMLRHVQNGLWEDCLRIPEDNSALIPALWRCWSFIDLVHRIREIAQTLPISGKTPELKLFLAETKIAEKYRHYIQHLRGELAKQPEENPFPVWGSLSWADAKDPTKCSTVFAGAQLPGTNYSGCVYDNLERKWASRVCLGTAKLAFNFDLIYDATLKFEEFIIPWMTSTYKPQITVQTTLPIISMQFMTQSEAAARGLLNEKESRSPIRPD